MAKREKVRVVLVGAGWIGAHHGENVLRNPHAELSGVCDPDPGKAKAFVERAGGRARAYARLEDALREPEVDAVVIATPNALHAGQAVAAAQAGKHIYLEKPMGITLESCRQAARAVAKAGVKCRLGYHRRFNPLVIHARQLIAEGKMGELVLAESDYFHYVPGDLDIWEWLGKTDIAGSLIHAGTGHNVDLLRYFCGEVAEVSCFKDIRMPRTTQIQTEDIAILNLRFEGGALGRVGLFLGPILPFTFTLRLFGTRGSLDNERIWLDSIPRFAESGHGEDCIRLPKAWIWDNVQGGVSETWRASLDAFVDDVRLDRQPDNDAVSGFNTAAVCFAALRSAAEGRSVRPERL
jgi:UDP-N-acetyl-2-amino-2-deoxyglucuronate dehydrogenase